MGYGTSKIGKTGEKYISVDKFKSKKYRLTIRPKKIYRYFKH